MRIPGFWEFIQSKINAEEPLIVMVVLESIGSSPGRQGFKMAVTESELFGSVGGGIMEHKFVEMARDHLRKNLKEITLRHQIHSKESPKNQSGMICSGEQTIALIPIEKQDQSWIQEILISPKSQNTKQLAFNKSGIRLIDKTRKTGFTGKDDPEWEYIENLADRLHLHIVGGGHVSLAFSKLMADLDFEISLYDDRLELNTFLDNQHVQSKQIIDYEEIDQYIPIGPEHLVVIMTFGYRTDLIALRRLLGKHFFYLGLLGSKKKIEKMWLDLLEEGVLQTDLDKVHAPVGIFIKSETPMEIAVSIAAEIILLKNTL